jgi:uncharacterized membrane protein YeaQ/YmgE (transglycosylase-associated protein family)
MSVIVFILLGVAVWAFTHRLFNSTGVDVAVELCLGVTGAIIAGVLFHQLAAADASELTIVVIAGAAVPLTAYRTVFREPTSRRHDLG